MISASECIYHDEIISIEKALELRSKDNIASRENFSCIECGMPVRPHRASDKTNHPEHFEHFKRNSACSYSDSYEGSDLISTMSHPVLDEYSEAYITSFWGFSPSTWGCVGFSKEGRRDTIIRKTSDPFVMVIYVTENAGPPEQGEVDYRGKVAGFYLVSHEKVDRREATDKKHHDLEPEKWKYSLKAIKAYEISPQDRPSIREFEPSIYGDKTYRSISANGGLLSKSAFKMLKSYSFREIPVYGAEAGSDFDVVSPSLGADDKSSKGYVTGGNVNGSGYYVAPEGESEKELYLLKMEGDVDAFLVEPAKGRNVYKVGLSMNPKSREKHFNRSMPEGRFSWKVVRSTKMDGDEPYPNFKIAEKGERAMKIYLSNNSKWLGGEFYLSTEEAVNKSWLKGKVEALRFRNELQDSLSEDSDKSV